MGFQCLCDLCHNIKHWGRSVLMVHEGKLPANYIVVMTSHFCKVNSCDLVTLQLHQFEVGELQLKRNRHKYKIDFGSYSGKVKE